MAMYAKLRGAMVAADVDATHLARALRVSVKHVSMLLNGHARWRLDDAYAALDALHIDKALLTEYFPPMGGAEQGGRAQCGKILGEPAAARACRRRT